MRVNLGAGSRYIEGWVNVDRIPMQGIDVVHDLDVGPWPFETDSVELVEALHVFEHVADPVLFMTEVWRILKPGAMVVIICPHFTHPSAFTDPTHRRYPTQWTMDYWIPGTLYYQDSNRQYGGVAFEKIEYRILPGAESQRWKLRKIEREEADIRSMHIAA